MIKTHLKGRGSDHWSSASSLFKRELMSHSLLSFESQTVHDYSEHILFHKREIRTIMFCSFSFRYEIRYNAKWLDMEKVKDYQKDNHFLSSYPCFFSRFHERGRFGCVLFPDKVFLFSLSGNHPPLSFHLQKKSLSTTINDIPLIRNNCPEAEGVETTRGSFSWYFEKRLLVMNREREREAFPLVSLFACQRWPKTTTRTTLITTRIPQLFQLYI